jgi:beta-aspartyl-dipeptidase (metallo-type)
MKAKSLREQGIAAWMLTGAYQVATPTVSGDIGRDIATIDEIIGVGEIAVSDHRASAVRWELLVEVASKARVGGMLGGKSGIVQLHMGDARDPLKPVYEAVEHSMVPLDQFMPTHMNRNRWIFRDAMTFGKEGGRIDLTASSYPYFPEDEIKPSTAVRNLLDEGVALDRITMSSDGNGSLPSFDENGVLKRLEVGQPVSIFREMVDLVETEGLAVQTALAVVTRNPARAFGLRRKGHLEPGLDADIVVVDEDWRIVHLLSAGAFLVQDRVAKKGSFEE